MAKVIATTRGENFRTKPKNYRQTVGRTLRYLGSAKWMFIFVIIASLVEVTLNVGGTFMIKIVLDSIVKPINEGTMERITLLYTFLIMIGCYLVGFFFNFVQALLMVRIAQTAVKNMRNELLNKLIKMPLSFYDVNTHGDIMSRFTNDIDMINELFTTSFMEIMTSVFIITAVTVCIFILNWILALVSMVFIPLMVLSIQYFTKKSRKEFHETQISLGKLEGYSEEILAGQRIVKCFNKEEDSIETFAEINKEVNDHSYTSNFNSTLTMPIVNNLTSVNYVLCCLIAALLLFYGVTLPGASVTPGVLISFIAFTKQFNRPLNRITQQIPSIQMALAGADRVYAILDSETEVEHDDNVYHLEYKDNTAYWVGENEYIKVKGDIRLYDVDFSYVKNQPILQDLSLYAKPGQKIAFVGATGAGKTTITNLLTRFYNIDNGLITIDGIDISKIDRYSLRSTMTLVLQETHLFTGTIMDNIRFGRLDATDEECIEAAKIAHAHSFIKKLPDGYNTIIYGTNDTLSQGQRQLLSISRCAVNNPPILILDEATSSVDTRTEKLISKGMDELMKDKTTFVIAHRLSTVKNSNAIMVLDHGKIIERGDHDDLINQKGVYYSLCMGTTKLE